MKEQIINFELSKLVKEKGFDWEVLRAYNSNGERVPYDIDGGYYDYNELEEDFSAPTLAHLQQWLREVHNCIVEITFYIIPRETKISSTKDILWEIEINYYGSDFEIEQGVEADVELEGFKTYEGALKIGLMEALKLIEDEKS